MSLDSLKEVRGLGFSGLFFVCFCLRFWIGFGGLGLFFLFLFEFLNGFGGLGLFICFWFGIGCFRLKSEGDWFGVGCVWVGRLKWVVKVWFFVMFLF